jgi:hypothetical protein
MKPSPANPRFTGNFTPRRVHLTPKTHPTTPYFPRFSLFMLNKLHSLVIELYGCVNVNFGVLKAANYGKLMYMGVWAAH